MDIFFYLILFKFIEPIIVFPFSISTSKEFLSINKNYTITNFFLDYLNREFYTTIDIGTPSQKLFSIISSDYHMFSLSTEEFIPKCFESNKELNLISKNSFNPSFSSSYKKIKDIKLYSKKPKNKAIVSESIHLYNSTNEKIEKISKIKVENINIIFEEDKDELKYGIIGLNYETSSKDVPYIVNELKKLNKINDYNWSFKFLSKTEGQLIISSLPHNYEKNHKYYSKNKYTKILSSSAGDYSYPWSIYFNQLYIKKNDNKLIASQITKCSLDPNLGFIIGNTKYKNLLLENYFNDLINNNICQLEKTELTKYNQTKIFYGTNGIYEFFTCNKNTFENYKKKFMPLFFDLPKYNYTFNLNDDDLFMDLNDKYYFLVAFPENINESFYIHCFLGLPFYQKYRLVFNFDSKTIGFYNQFIIDDNEEDEYKNKNENNRYKIINNANGKNYIKIIFEIIFCFLLFFVAYYVGKKLNEQRKKRANELNDDSYEYILQNNKDINNKIMNFKNVTKENENKILEMSSEIKK